MDNSKYEKLAKSIKKEIKKYEEINTPKSTKRKRKQETDRVNKENIKLLCLIAKELTKSHSACVDGRFYGERIGDIKLQLKAKGYLSNIYHLMKQITIPNYYDTYAYGSTKGWESFRDAIPNHFDYLVDFEGYLGVVYLQQCVIEQDYCEVCHKLQDIIHKNGDLIFQGRWLNNILKVLKQCEV